MSSGPPATTASQIKVVMDYSCYVIGLYASPKNSAAKTTA